MSGAVIKRKSDAAILPRSAGAPEPRPVLAAVADDSDWALPPARSKRGHDRREAILDAATEEFLNKGYQGASLRSIIAVAGGSSRTLYQQFGDKAGLFRAIVARLGGSHGSLVVPQVSDARPIGDELNEIGVAYLSTFLQPEPLAFFRMMIAESATQPEVPLLVWSVTQKPFAARFAHYLEGKCALEGCPLEDPELAALQFIELVKASIHLEILFGGTRPDDAEIARRVRLAVDLFLNGARGARPMAADK